jgi:preprotein translocase SecE subunit
MASNVVAAGGAEEPRDDRPTPTPRPTQPAGPGFFNIYKKGQGYWTRMGTAAGALLLGGLTAYNIAHYLPDVINLGSDQAAANREHRIALGVAAGFVVAFAVFAWRMMNKPSNVDFLIATDSEMKKVNWTSRRDLIGSTKVVIVFMFLIALILFLVDIIFSYFFYLIGVLKHSPFGGGGTIGGG